MTQFNELPSNLPRSEDDGVIIAVHYPIFPSDSGAPWVLNYLEVEALKG